MANIEESLTVIRSSDSTMWRYKGHMRWDDRVWKEIMRM